jgi:hypothetical protein
MTETSIITAVAVGLVVGVLVRWLVPACRRVPFWLPPAVGVAAAVMGTVAARLGGVDSSRVSAVELVLQLVLACSAVGAVALTAERKPPHKRSGRTGGPR